MGYFKYTDVAKNNMLTCKKCSMNLCIDCKSDDMCVLCDNSAFMTYDNKCVTTCEVVKWGII